MNHPEFIENRSQEVAKDRRWKRQSIFEEGRRQADSADFDPIEVQITPGTWVVDRRFQEHIKSCFERAVSAEELEYLLTDMKSSDIERSHSGLIGIRKLFDGKQTQEQDVQNEVKFILQLVKEQIFPQLQLQAIKIVCYFRNLIPQMMEMGMVPIVVELLRSNRKGIVEQAIKFIEKCIFEFDLGQQICRADGLQIILDNIDLDNHSSMKFLNILSVLSLMQNLEQIQSKRATLTFCKLLACDWRENFAIQDLFQYLSVADCYIFNLEISKQVAETGVLPYLIEAFQEKEDQQILVKVLSLLRQILNMVDSKTVIEEALHLRIVNGLCKLTSKNLKSIQIRTNVVQCFRIQAVNSKTCLLAIFQQESLIDQIIKWFYELQKKTYIISGYTKLLNLEIVYLFQILLEGCQCQKIFDIFLEKGLVRFYFSFLDSKQNIYIKFTLCWLEKFLKFGDKYKKGQVNRCVQSFIKIGGEKIFKSILMSEDSSIFSQGSLKNIIATLLSNKKSSEQFMITPMGKYIDEISKKL